MKEKDKELDNLATEMQHFMNKYGSIDVEKKVADLSKATIDQGERLNELETVLNQLFELQQEFDGYVSDAFEEDFIEKLEPDLKEI